jgi:prepilin-type N-terminal cleavage/methylation domain-containing protein
MSNLKHHTSATILRRHPHAGFTLLEILVVIGLLSILALGASTMLIDEGERFIETRNEETEARWKALRTAIIGDSNIVLNGSPYMSGYVADMGRLPANIDELTSLVYDYDDDGDPITPNVDVPAQTQTPYQSYQLSTITPNMTGELSGGWRGPYIYSAGSNSFRDGWENTGNPSTGVDNPDSYNFGWNVTFTGTPPTHTEIFIQSVGSADPADNFPNPNIALVGQNEWQLNNPTITFYVTINKAPSADVNDLELRLYFFEDNGIQEVVSTSRFTQLTSGAYPDNQVLTINGPLPMGKYAVVVWCTNSTPTDPLDDAVYDGDCDIANTKLPNYITLLPNAVMPISIQWNLP